MAFACYACLLYHRPASSFVIVEIHQTATLLAGSPLVILLPFTNVDKALRKLVSVFDVVPAAAPDPLLVEALGSAGPGTAARRQLTFATRPRDGVHYPGRCDRMRERRLATSYLEDWSEDGGILNSGAIPPPVAELPLTLGDAGTGTPPHRAHVILVELTQLGLSR